jgi:FkbH-like protein
MNNNEMFSQIEEAIKAKDSERALLRMQAVASPDSPFFELMRLARCLDEIDLDSLSLKPIRIALVGTSTLDQFAMAFKVWLNLCGFTPEFFIADFNTVEQSILDPESKMYAFGPDLVWIFSNYRDFLPPFLGPTSPQVLEEAVGASVDRFSSLWDQIRQHSDAYVFQNNADIPAYRTVGNFEGNVGWSGVGFLRAVNRKLAERMEGAGTVVDIEFLSSLVGKIVWFDERFWYHSKHACSLDASGLLAYKAARLVAGLKGQSRKCLVLDLDNTLWGGVIGDDGLDGLRLGSGPEGEAFVAFQEYLLSLKNRGVVLAVCSKNEEENGKLPFQKHPSMRLSLDDIAVFVANWENKADNIRFIAETLGLGLESFVFVDDNPAERKLVKDLLPMVEVPEMPSDPAGYVAALDQLALFETVNFSPEDAKRAAMYRDNAMRNEQKKCFTDLSSFLQSLRMQSCMGNFADLSLPRISQLINKSNQFHLTTTRYSEAEIRGRREAEDHVCMDFSLSDRFGDNGLICAVILRLKGEDAIIDTWVMSCRVLSRQMEHFVYNAIRGAAAGHGCARVVGIYKPTKKNKMVSGLYEKLGFTLLESCDEATVWAVDAQAGEAMPHHITLMTDGDS